MRTDIDLGKLLRGLVAHVEEWAFEDLGKGEYNYCRECEARYRVGVTMDQMKHKPGCELRELLDMAEAQFAEWDRVGKVVDPV